MFTAYAASVQPNQVAGETASELANLIEIIISKIPLWIAAFIVIVVAFLGAKIIRGIVESKLADKIEEEHQEIQILAGRMTYAGIMALGVTIGLKIAGIDLTSIIAAVAFGIGFALKDMIMNFLAGIMVLLSRHFTIGDFINVGGTLGKVVEIQSRVTVLQAFDGTKVIVPNADLFQKQVTSLTSNPFRRIEILVGVDYRNDLENVIRVIMSVLKHTHGVLAEPKPAVVVDSFADSAINLKVKAWAESHGGVIQIKSRLVIAIKQAFDEYGITIPWPIRTIVYDKDQEHAERQMEEEKIEKAVVQEVPATPAVAAPAPAAPTPSTAQMPEQPLQPLGEQV